MASSEGTAFGKYFLMKKIAAGGMGEIFLAKLKGPVGFEKLLVIKRILQRHVENEEFLDMFFAEARVAAQLTHSNIVQIYEMGEIEDAFFIAMEYVHGKSLRDIIDRARSLGEYIPMGHVIELISKLCAGLSYAHNAKNMSGESLAVIHRDINPHNILISYGGDVKVIDFGIAKSEISLHRTETGTIKGKFVYMSPEQSAAEKLDKRSDLFAAGICLHEALTFINPFAKANVVLSLDAIQRKDPAPPSEVNQRLAPFDPIVRRALAKKPEDRYPDCMDMREELQLLLTSGSIPPAEQPLSTYMQELFEEQIEQEKRMIIETDSASTVQIEAMRVAREADSRGMTGRLKAHPRPKTGSRPDADVEREFDSATDEQEIAAHAANVDVIDEAGETPHSRRPFLLALATIIAFTLLGSFVMVKTGPPAAATPIAMAMAMAMAPKAKDSSPAPLAAPAAEITSDSIIAHPLGADSVPVEPQPENARPGEPPPESDETPDPRGGNKKSDLGDEPEEEVEPAKKAKAGRPGKGRAKGKVKDDEAPGPDAAPEAATSDFGSFFVAAEPPLKATHKGRAGKAFKLKAATGTVTFGSAADTSKFHVKVSYRVKDREVVFTSVTSEPWAIVKGKGGMGIGKTPLSNVQGGLSTVFEMLNPKAGLSQKITLRYSPP